MKPRPVPRASRASLALRRYFEASPNHDAVALRVVGDAEAETIMAQIDALGAKIRPNTFILPNTDAGDGVGWVLKTCLRPRCVAPPTRMPTRTRAQSLWAEGVRLAAPGVASLDVVLGPTDGAEAQALLSSLPPRARRARRAPTRRPMPCRAVPCRAMGGRRYDDMLCGTGKTCGGIFSYGTWVNGGVWSTQEARAILAYAPSSPSLRPVRAAHGAAAAAAVWLRGAAAVACNREQLAHVRSHSERHWARCSPVPSLPRPSLSWARTQVLPHQPPRRRGTQHGGQSLSSNRPPAHTPHPPTHQHSHA